jgi:hypothetical protein
MSEITRQDLISDDALEAPAILTKELEKLLVVVGQVKTSSKEIGQGIGGAGLKQSKEDTNKLTEEMRVLATVSKQIKTETAKQSDEYQKQATILKDLKEQQKQRNALGDKEAINVRAATSSIKELEAALKANRAAYAALRTEEERNTKTGKDLSKAIEEQYNEVVKLNKGMGVHKDTVGNYEGALTGLKAELKAARGEMVAIADTLGQSSKEYQAAAKRAGEIGDKIADAKDEAKAFQGDTAIENLGTRFGLLGDKVKSLDFKGAATQIRGIADISKAMTFKEAIAGLGGFGSALGQLGKALFTNPIFLIAGAIAAAVIAFKYFESQAEKLTTSMIERSKREMDALTKRYDNEIKLMEIAHKDATELELEKQRAIIKTAETAIKASGDTMKIDYLASLASRSIVFQANEEKILKLKEFNEAKKSAENEIELIEARRKQKQIDDAKEVTDKLIKEGQERIKKIKALIAEEEADQAFDYNVSIIYDDTVADFSPKVLDQLDDLFSQTKNAIDQARNQELQDKAEHNANLLKTDLSYQENRRALFRQQVIEIRDGLSEANGYYQQFSSAILNLSNALTVQRIGDIDSEINKERERANNEILLAGGNAEAKARIQAQSEIRIAALEKKRRKEERDAAEQAKTLGIVSAVIKTALAVLNQLSSGDPYTAFARAAAAGSLGAIEIAAISSQPLPKYFKGTDFHQGGKAIVGEQGAELMVMPSGNLQLTPSHATVVDIPRGTEVIPNAETMRMLAMAGITRPEMIESRKDNRLLNELKELKQITAKNRPGKTNLTRNMATVYESRKVSETMTQKVRALSMGEFGL